MTDVLAALLAALPPAGSWTWAAVAAVMGAVGGRLLTSRVGGLLDDGVFGEPPSAGGVSRRRIELAAVAVAVGLWWWEARRLGLGPEDQGGAPMAASTGVLLARWAAHAFLFWLLAAASWIDFRHRVIPDCVTVPGVIAGIVLTWFLPDLLLPIACEEPRSFAPPLAVSDVLAWWGGLRAQSPPHWLGARPQFGGFVVPAVIFWAWWFFLTAPFLQPESSFAPAARGRRRRIEPRTFILPAGIAAIAAAWAGGGERFGGLQSAIVGMAVSAALVWAVREGASRALGREAMGLGDVTLMAMVGAWVGWQASLLAFFIAAFIGLAHGVVQLVRHRESELPYGPSLCLATAVVIVGWRPLWHWAGPAFAEPLELAVVLVVVVLLTAATLFGWSRFRGQPE